MLEKLSQLVVTALIASSLSLSSTSFAKDDNLKLCISDWPSNMVGVALHKMGRLVDANVNFTDFQTCVKRFEKGLEDLMIVSAPEYITFRSQGLKFTVVDIEDNSTGGDGVVLRKGMAPKDLKGKKIGIQVDSTAILTLDLFLKKHALALKDVVLVDLKSENVDKGISSGKVDAVVTWNPSLQEAAKNGGEIVFTTKEAREKIFDPVIVRNEVLQNPKKKAALKHYINEWHKGVQEEPVKAKMAEIMKVSVPDLKAMLADAEIYQTKADAKAAIPKLQAVFLENVKTFSAPEYRKIVPFAKSIPQNYDIKMYENCCTTEFLD
jgi:ABC-type amino acid transport substrate-binding protein